MGGFGALGKIGLSGGSLKDAAKKAAISQAQDQAAAAMGDNELAGNMMSGAIGAAGDAASASRMSLDPSAAAYGSRQTMKMEQSGDKKGGTILTPHLDLYEHGAMHIVLDNEQTSKPSNQPITGRILVNLKSEFDASALTMQLQGYTRTHFSNGTGGNAD